MNKLAAFSNITINKNRSVFFKLVSFVLLLAVYLFDIFYIYRNGQLLMNSDSASELVLAQQLNKEGGILSTNWYYSTELRVLNTQLVYKLALALFPSNWRLALTFSGAILLLILVLCCLWLAGAIGQRKIGFTLAVLSCKRQVLFHKFRQLIFQKNGI